MPKFKFIDLFSGIGGFHLAMHENEGECVFASEIDKFARKTYKNNFKSISPDLFKSNFFNKDITDPSLDYSEIPDFNVLCAGFPCQPFSYAGKNEGFKDKTRGTLFFSILSILQEKKPDAFFLENVKGLKSHDKGRTLKTIIDALENLGYKVHWEILDSLNFGVPQKRERWYCVGFLDHNIDFKFPKSLNCVPKLRDIVDITINDDGLKLPKQELERINFHFENFDPKTNVRVQHDNSQYRAETKKGKHGIFSFQKNDGSLRFHIGDTAKTQIQEMFYACLDTYSPTIIYNRVPKLWDIERKLSVQECLRLQGFPDDYEFPVSDNQAYKQLGNSVALPVVKAISKKIVEHLS
ncbi:MAG: DNA (cytosine-5-)-methyltransferase [Balneolaceae bacterium]|nr:DNA (cytosine-5-)-methyltransferase [Balneolaceae bacterium]